MPLFSLPDSEQRKEIERIQPSFSIFLPFIYWRFFTFELIFSKDSYRLSCYLSSPLLHTDFSRKLTKTPGYLRDILRPPTLLKMPFCKDKSVFLNTFFIILSTNFNFFRVLSENLKNRMERNFREKIPIETHSGKKLPHVAILENFKFFFEKTHLSKKTRILNVLRILTIAVAFCGIFATI